MDACKKIYFYPPIVTALQFILILATGAALLAAAIGAFISDYFMW